MVLCVSNVTWTPAGVDEDGMRANVDEPLERAIRKGHLRIGGKIAVANARVG